MQEKVSDASATDPTKAEQAVPDSSEDAQEQSKQPKQQQEPEQQEQELTVASGGDDGGYESSDEDVARVHALHSSALEFIKSLKDTDEESIGEPVTDSADKPPMPPAPDATAAPMPPIMQSASEGGLLSHPIAPSPEASGSDLPLDCDPPQVPRMHPTHMPLSLPLPAVASQSSDEEEPLQPMVAAATNGGGEESLRAWLEGQSDCDMAGSALIASPGNSAELFGAAAYESAGATTVATSAAVASAGMPTSTAIGPSVPGGRGSVSSGGKGGSSGRGRSGSKGSGSSGRRKSSIGRFSVAGTLTALPEPTLPPIQAQWDVTPFGRVGVPPMPPKFTTAVGPDGEEQDPSDRAAAEHAQQQMQKKVEESERSAAARDRVGDANAPSKSIPEVSGAEDAATFDVADNSKGGTGSVTSAEVSAAVPQASGDQEGSREKATVTRQDFQTHVNELLNAVKFVKQRHVFTKNSGKESVPEPPAPTARRSDPALAPKPRARRGSTAAAEAAAEAAALLLGGGAGARGVGSGGGSTAAGSRRGRTHERAASPGRAASVPQKQRTVMPIGKPTRHVFAPAEVASKRAPHPTSFARHNTAAAKHAAPDRMRKLFATREFHKVVGNASRRMYGGDASPARGPLRTLQRPAPSQPFNPVAANAASIASHTPAVRRSRSVSRASSRNASIEFDDFPSAPDMPTFSKFPDDCFTFTEGSESPPRTPRAPRSTSRSARGRAHSTLAPKCSRLIDTDAAPQAGPTGGWRSSSLQPQMSSDQVSAVLTARDKRMSGNAGVHGHRDASCGRGRAARSMTSPPIRGTSAATAAAAARSGLLLPTARSPQNSAAVCRCL